ncbi:DUF2620 family protein [Olsenella sp. HMSC062G07]|uniref:DUF2620 family protein n=1 Tax=Olsenella sp. HMSC062G07 TaxID=1739330 RepID=UPI0008B6F962|nr:DUF2620 family protein [Olsenella sp. HMSC062G07]OFK23650.1 hypothetical protein HMPREF2826_03900 [Olsenella sp. HMSC062G07]
MRIVIGGQLGKQEIEQCIRSLNLPGVEVEILDDMQATMDIQSGRADYYLGACLTGGGGALAMAIALLGYGKCRALTEADEATIKAALDAGVKAFGFTPQLTSQVVPLLVGEMAGRK